MNYYKATISTINQFFLFIISVSTRDLYFFLITLLHRDYMQQSSPSSVSPLTKIVFIKRVCLFACRLPSTTVKLTTGINKDFKEAMVVYNGFVECIAVIARNTTRTIEETQALNERSKSVFSGYLPYGGGVRYSRGEELIGSINYVDTNFGAPEFLLRSRRKLNDRQRTGLLFPPKNSPRDSQPLLVRLLTDVSYPGGPPDPLILIWMIPLLASADRKYYFSLDVKHKTNLLAIILDAIFRCPDADLIIETLKQLQQLGQLPQDLSTATFGPAQQSLLHLLLCARTACPSMTSFQLPLMIGKERNDDDKELRKKEACDDDDSLDHLLPAVTTVNRRMIHRAHKLFSFLIRDCGIHPFKVRNQNGSNAFLTAVRRYSPQKHLPLIKLMVSLLPKEELENVELMRDYVNGGSKRQQQREGDGGANPSVMQDNLIVVAAYMNRSPESMRGPPEIESFNYFIDELGFDPRPLAHFMRNNLSHYWKERFRRRLEKNADGAKVYRMLLTLDPIV